MQSRRHFLTSASAALLAAPFLNLLNGGGVTRAQGAAAPAKRLLIFFSPNGTIPQLWRPAGGEDDYRFNADGMLTPLNDYRDDLLVLNGINFLTGNNHEGGMGAMLTNGNGAGSVSDGVSIDQFVAQRIGAEDRFNSMEFGVLTDPWGASIQTRMSYSGAGQYLHPDADPRSVFRRMFGGISQDEQARENVRLRRRSILDISLSELNGIRGRVGGIERRKLDRHLDSIRSLERSLFPENEGACQTPAAPGRMNKDDFAMVPQLARAQIDLAVTALACQMTKVATIQLSHTVSPVVFSWVGNTDGHHSLSHAADGDAVHIDQFREAERWCASQFAYIIDQLKATPNPEGDGSIFDDTVILWAKELGDSRLHVCESVPFVLAGPAGGAFRPGRYLDYGGVSHSKLLVSICQAFGLDVDTFGDPATGRGGLDRLV
jgi:hypothetical protein